MSQRATPQPITRVVILVEHEGIYTQVTQIAGADSLFVHRRRFRFGRRRRRLTFTLVNPGPATTFDPALVVAPPPKSVVDWESHIAAVEQFNERRKAA